MREWMKQAESLASSTKKWYITIPMLILLLIPTIPSLLIDAESIRLPLQRVPAITMDHDHSETTQNLTQMISDNGTLDVIAYTDEKNDLREAFYCNKAPAGIMILEHFSEGPLNGREAKIVISNDGALLAVASGMRGAITEALGTIKGGYMLKLVEGEGIPPQTAMNLVAPMGYVTEAVSNPSKNVTYMMVEGILLTIVQIGAGCAGVRVCERGSPGRLMKGAGFITGIACISALGCIVTQTLCSGFLYKSSPWTGILMMVFICFGITLFGILQNLGTEGNCGGAVQKCSIISFTALLTGYTFSVTFMPWPCKFPAWFMPNTHYIVLFRDMILVEHSFLNEIHHVLQFMGFYAAIVLVVTKRFRDAGTEPGKTPADGSRMEGGVAGI